MARSMKDVNIFSGLADNTNGIHNNPTQQLDTTHTSIEHTQAPPVKQKRKTTTQNTNGKQKRKAETEPVAAPQTQQETTQSGWAISIPKKAERRSERLQLVTTPSLMRRVGVLADAYGVSRNELINLVLEQFCEHQEGSDGQ